MFLSLVFSPSPTALAVGLPSQEESQPSQEPNPKPLAEASDNSPSIRYHSREPVKDPHIATPKCHAILNPHQAPVAKQTARLLAQISLAHASLLTDDPDIHNALASEMNTHLFQEAAAQDAANTLSFLEALKAFMGHIGDPGSFEYKELLHDSLARAIQKYLSHIYPGGPQSDNDTAEEMVSEFRDRVFPRSMIAPSHSVLCVDSVCPSSGINVLVPPLEKGPAIFRIAHAFAAYKIRTVFNTGRMLGYIQNPRHYPGHQLDLDIFTPTLYLNPLSLINYDFPIEKYLLHDLLPGSDKSSDFPPPSPLPSLLKSPLRLTLASFTTTSIHSKSNVQSSTTSLPLPVIEIARLRSYEAQQRSLQHALHPYSAFRSKFLDPQIASIHREFAFQWKHLKKLQAILMGGDEEFDLIAETNPIEGKKGWAQLQAVIKFPAKAEGNRDGFSNSQDEIRVTIDFNIKRFSKSRSGRLPETLSGEASLTARVLSDLETQITNTLSQIE